MEYYSQMRCYTIELMKSFYSKYITILNFTLLRALKLESNYDKEA